MTDTIPSVQPRFLGNTGEKHFVLQFLSTQKPAAHIVFIPPFGEEMNRCRALVADQARSFARLGYVCSLIDFFGTGDSEGELSEASFQTWHDNIRLTIETVQREIDAPLILWGLRLGGLIALDFASKSPLPVQDIILWQPVTSGKRYVTQMLRQRVAALVGRDLPPETTSEIRQRLEDGDNVEISGYTVGGALIRDIEKFGLAEMSGLCSGKVFWLENISEEGQELGTASRKSVEQLASQENVVDVRTFTGPPVWQLHKRDVAPELITVTNSLLS